MMILNAFTCTGPYAVLILYGIKRTESRSAASGFGEGRTVRNSEMGEIQDLPRLSFGAAFGTI